MASALWYSSLLANVFVWIGIALCITQSAIFSGLNLAIFSISKLRLEVEAVGGNRDASGLLALRKDSNLTLATVLWGNVRGGPVFRNRMAAWLRWILGWIMPPICPRLLA
jgi:CBS domain containing-hemolysin-like protein